MNTHTQHLEPVGPMLNFFDPTTSVSWLSQIDLDDSSLWLTRTGQWIIATTTSGVEDDRCLYDIISNLSAVRWLADHSYLELPIVGDDDLQPPFEL